MRYACGPSYSTTENFLHGSLLEHGTPNTGRVRVSLLVKESATWHVSDVEVAVVVVTAAPVVGGAVGGIPPGRDGAGLPRRASSCSSDALAGRAQAGRRHLDDASRLTEAVHRQIPQLRYARAERRGIEQTVEEVAQ